jgi:hypothetical protein
MAEVSVCQAALEGLYMEAANQSNSNAAIKKGSPIELSSP